MKLLLRKALEVNKSLQLLGLIFCILLQWHSNVLNVSIHAESIIQYIENKYGMHFPKVKQDDMEILFIISECY